MAVNNIATVCSTIALMPLMARMLWGRLPLSAIIIYHYNVRITVTLTISLITIKTILMTLFIKYFDTMTGSPLKS